MKWNVSRFERDEMQESWREGSETRWNYKFIKTPLQTPTADEAFGVLVSVKKNSIGFSLCDDPWKYSPWWKTIVVWGASVEGFLQIGLSRNPSIFVPHTTMVFHHGEYFHGWSAFARMRFFYSLYPYRISLSNDKKEENKWLDSFSMVVF